jgi:hypothetical protein
MKGIKLNSESLFLMLGVFSTSSLLTIPVGGHLISLYMVCYILCVFVLLTGKRNNFATVSKLVKSYDNWTIIGVFSSLFGFLFFWGDWEWQSAALSYIPKLLMYLLFFHLLIRSANSMDYCKSIAKGLLVGIIVNIIVAVIDAVIFYVSSQSIINNFFSYYIEMTGIRFGMISIIYPSSIRSCGLNSDPANIGMFVIILAAYSFKKRNLVLLGLSLLGALAALSHTGIVGIVLVTLFHYFFRLKKKNFKHKISMMVGVLLLVFLLTNSNIAVINQMGDSMNERTEMKLEKGSQSEGARKSYWVNFIPAVISQPISFVIGTGYGTASYAYLNNELVQTAYFPYDPEQTYFSTYFDVGLSGFLIFMSLIITVYKYLSRLSENRQVAFLKEAMLGSMVAFLGYHYTLYSVFMLLLITAIVLLDKAKINYIIKSRYFITK